MQFNGICRPATLHLKFYILSPDSSLWTRPYDFQRRQILASRVFKDLRRKHRKWEPVIAKGHSHGPNRDPKEESQKPKRDIPTDRSRIPAQVYRPVGFMDVAQYVREMTVSEQIFSTVGFFGLLAFVAWVRNLGAAGPFRGIESVVVEAARHMRITRDFAAVSWNSALPSSVLAPACWPMALSSSVLGDQLWAYRLPSCLLAVGLMVGLYMTVLRFGVQLFPSGVGGCSKTPQDNVVPAITASAAFALNLGVIATGSTAFNGMILTATVAASLLCFFWGYVRGGLESGSKDSGLYLLSAVFLGFAFLSGGLLVGLLPVCVILIFLVCTGEISQVLLHEFPKIQWMLTVALVSLPWHVLMLFEHKSTTAGVMNIHQALRSLVLRHCSQPWWSPLAALSIMYFPWCLSVPSTLVGANPWNSKDSWRDGPRSRNLVKFAATWFISGTALGVLTAGHWTSYLLVAPAVAFLAASHLSSPVGLLKDGLSTGLFPALMYQILAGVFLLVPWMLENPVTSEAFAVIGGHMVAKYGHYIGLVIFATGGMLATRTEEYAVAYGSKNIVTDKGSSKGKTLLPLWVVHTVTMLALSTFLVTPCFKVVHTIPQVPATITGSEIAAGG